jgi:Uncharacterized protein conserved in bacteria
MSRAKSFIKNLLRLFFVIAIVVGVFIPAQAVAYQTQTAQMNANSAFDSQMKEIMQKADKNMMATPMTGNPDNDFIAMMIPHHQSAIDMAKAYLQYGKDPTLRQMAQDIITKQSQEIEELRHLQTTLKSNQ